MDCKPTVCDLVACCPEALLTAPATALLLAPPTAFNGVGVCTFSVIINEGDKCEICRKGELVDLFETGTK